MQALKSLEDCHQVALEKSSLSKEEIDKLFTIEVCMAGQKVKLPTTPEVITILKRLFMEV
jgi:hypothetical protein